VVNQTFDVSNERRMWWYDSANVAITGPATDCIEQFEDDLIEFFLFFLQGEGTDEEYYLMQRQFNEDVQS
jgi:hypothetical protein